MARGIMGTVGGMTWARRRAMLLLIFWVLLAACGKKGPPIPPERLRPVSVASIQVDNVNAGVRLRWRAPRKKINNQPLEQLARFDLLRAQGPTREACGGPAARWERLATFSVAGEPLEALFSYLDESAVTGRWYSYRIIAVDLDGNVSDAPASLPLIFRGTPPPQAPAPVTQPGDGFVTLRMADFPEDVLGWRLFRSGGDADSPGLFPLFSAAVTGPEYTDGGVENDRWYNYAAAWLREDEGFIQQGALSPPVMARPIDLIPPPAPQRIVAIPRAAGLVELRWERVDEPRVRYHVYRRSGEQLRYRRLTAEPVSEPIYEDRPGRGTHFYAVTSLDMASNESSRGEPSQVQVR
jgi:hypothetical protein